MGISLFTRLCLVMVASRKRRSRPRPPPRPFTDDEAGHGCSIRRTSCVEWFQSREQRRLTKACGTGIGKRRRVNPHQEHGRVPFTTRLRSFRLGSYVDQHENSLPGGQLPPTCTQAAEFKGRFGVHTFFVVGRGGDGSRFSTADTAPHRNCVPPTPTSKLS